MDAIAILVEEHQTIKIVLKTIRRLCLDIINGQKVDHDLFTQIIDFVRNYADKYHHQKEENHLFKQMAELANDPPNTGPIMGMLLEHDLGRNYISNLEKAVAAHKGGSEEAKLDLIANAISYEQLLQSHIDKEDKVIYQMGTKLLSTDQLAKLTALFTDLEHDPANLKHKNKYLNFAAGLKKSLHLSD